MDEAGSDALRVSGLRVSGQSVQDLRVQREMAEELTGQVSAQGNDRGEQTQDDSTLFGVTLTGQHRVNRGQMGIQQVSTRLGGAGIVLRIFLEDSVNREQRISETRTLRRISILVLLHNDYFHRREHVGSVSEVLFISGFE